MPDDSELDYIADFLRKIHTAHTIETIETTRSINDIIDDKSILLYAGESIGSKFITVSRRYHLQYKDTVEGTLNASLYALIEGIRKELSSHE